MVTVGYGDVLPLTTNTKGFTIFVMLFSSGFFAFIMNKIGFIFKELELKRE